MISLEHVENVMNILTLLLIQLCSQFCDFSILLQDHRLPLAVRSFFPTLFPALFPAFFPAFFPALLSLFLPYGFGVFYLPLL